jgi:Rap1a immunity proteins
MMRRVIVLAAAMLAINGIARAQQWLNGNDLLGYCTNASTRPYCMYYIQGVWDAVENGQEAGSRPLRGRGCIRFPQGVNAQQVVDVVTRWLQAHPEIRHSMAGGLVWGAFSEAWPCPVQ